MIETRDLGRASCCRHLADAAGVTDEIVAALDERIAEARSSAWRLDLSAGPIFSETASRKKPHPMSNVLVGAPMTAKSVSKLAPGFADNKALTVLCECVTTVPLIILRV